jgi:hypothetical protein
VRATKIRLREFKANSRRLLPPGHPLLKILANVPDELDAAELDYRIGDWIALLEGGP